MPAGFRSQRRAATGSWLPPVLERYDIVSDRDVTKAARKWRHILESWGTPAKKESREGAEGQKIANLLVLMA